MHSDLRIDLTSGSYSDVGGYVDESPNENGTDRLRGFRQGLKDTGYVEGENVVIVYRRAENQFDGVPLLAAELVRRQVAVIAAETSLASLARPGGNLTGVKTPSS